MVLGHPQSCPINQTPKRENNKWLQVVVIKEMHNSGRKGVGKKESLNGYKNVN